MKKCKCFLIALFVALFFGGTLLVCYAAPLDYTTEFTVAPSPNMYDDVYVKITQFQQTDPEHQNPWSGQSVSKEFYADDGLITQDAYGTYFWTLYPYQGDWWDDGFITYESGGYWLMDVNIPFVSQFGQTLDSFKLNKDNLVKHILLGLQLAMYNNGVGSDVNADGFYDLLDVTVSAYTTLNTPNIILYRGGINNTLNGITVDIDEDVNFDLSSFAGIGITFRYRGLPRSDAWFQFAVKNYSMIEVFDQYAYNQYLIATGQIKVDELGNIIDSMENGDSLFPDIDYDYVNNVFDNAVSYGELRGLSFYNLVVGSPLGDFLAIALVTSVAVAFGSFVIFGRKT